MVQRVCVRLYIFIVITGSSRDIQNFHVDNVMIAVVRRRSHVLVTSSYVIIASIQRSVGVLIYGMLIEVRSRKMYTSYGDAARNDSVLVSAFA